MTLVVPCLHNMFMVLLIFALENINIAIGEYVYDNTIFLKWGILNVPFCSMFGPFHFSLIMTLVTSTMFR